MQYICVELGLADQRAWFDFEPWQRTWHLAWFRRKLKDAAEAAERLRRGLRGPGGRPGPPQVSLSSASGAPVTERAYLQQLERLRAERKKQKPGPKPGSATPKETPGG